MKEFELCAEQTQDLVQVSQGDAVGTVLLGVKWSESYNGVQEAALTPDEADAVADALRQHAQAARKGVAE